MARNEEKAQSMLYRFREAQAIELGYRREDRRPALASSVKSLTEADKWRRQIIREISRLVLKIQNLTASDDFIRDLNDDINRLFREKKHWENRIRELGGPDYRSTALKSVDSEGKEAPGTKGYRYFGRAKELPGVKELFEQAKMEVKKKSKAELSKRVDASYYGYDDENSDGLVEYEAELEKRFYESQS